MDTRLVDGEQTLRVRTDSCLACGSETDELPSDTHDGDDSWCPNCSEYVEITAGDILAFEHEGEEVSGSVMAIGSSGTIRVRGIGVVDIEPDQVIEVLEDAGGTNVDH